MKKLWSKFRNNCIDFLIIFNILYILIGTYLYTIRVSFSLQEMSKGFVWLEIVNFIISFIHYKKYKLSKIDILLFFIIIFLLISVYYAYNQKVALYGSSSRYEGLYSILYYFSLFLLATFSKNKRTIIYFILFCGVCPFIYSFCLYYHLFNLDSYIARHSVWATGFTTNSNFYGSFMLLCLSYSIGFLIEENGEIDIKIVYYMLVFLFSIGLFRSNTFSCIIGLFIVLFLSLYYCLKNHRIKKYIIVLCIILSGFMLLKNENKKSIYKDVITSTKEATSISKGKVDDSFGNYRLFIWKETIKEIPSNIWHGIGIDNLGYIKDGSTIRLQGRRGVVLFDKAHSEYLQILITEGIFCLVLYIALYFVVISRGLILSFNNKEIYLILPIIGYLIQATFNISVIEVAPFFFIAQGLVIDREVRKKRRL